MVDVGLKGESCIEPDMGLFLNKKFVAEFLVKKRVLLQEVRNRESYGRRRRCPCRFPGFEPGRFEPLALFIHQRDQGNR